MRKALKRICALAVVLSAVLLFSNMREVDAQEPLSFKLSPSVIPAGRTRSVKIRTTGNDDLTGFELQRPPEDTGVILSEPGGQLVDNKTAILAQLSVDEDADPQTLPLQIVKKNGAESETYTVDLTITAFTPKAMQKQAVPPNLEFQVDSMVQPMSYKGAKDVFGRRVADAYYAVAVSLGNNTGFDLQVNKIGFVTSIPMQAPDLDPKTQRPVLDANGKLKTHTELLEITAIDRPLIRSSIEKEQNFGVRALALNLLGGVGTLTTGFLPFFHALGPRANFSSFTSVINGQLKDGFVQSVPDLTIRHLNRLDSSLVMDQDFVLPNNSERNTVVFVPRAALGLADSDRDDLLKVREKLGSLVIVGRPIQRFENRQIVVRSGAAGERSRESAPTSPALPLTTATPPPAPISVDSVTPNFGTLSENKEVTIKGSGFTPDAPVTVKFGDRQVPGRARSATDVEAKVPPTAAAGKIDVQVIAGDRTTTPLKNAYEYIDELRIDSFDPASVPIAGAPNVKIKGKGFMSGAEVTVDGVKIENVSVNNDHNEITITVPAHAAGAVTVVVKNPNGKTFSFANALTYVAPPTPATPAPTPSPSPTGSPTP
jgi:hypothetical protein